jgi:hypothetical protein
MSKNGRYFLVAVICGLIMFIVLLALEHDRLNARIRALEIRAGFGDKWAK